VAAREGTAGENRGRLNTHVEVVTALARYHDQTRNSSPSLLRIDRDRTRVAGPFGFGFVSRVEEHAELVNKLRRLTPRERLLLLLWYTEQWPVTKIAERLGISRVHCYRVRDRALRAMLGEVEPSRDHEVSTPSMS
jgi:DNA-directed RNA polymerase specialized sigma24 family protein